MPKAFLSHSSKQKNLVETIAQRLGRENCVLDKFNFEVGLPTLDEIIRSIEKSDLFVFFLTDESLSSDWVKREIDFAKNLKDQNISKQLLILLIDNSISHNDERIPNWMAEVYNIRPITDPILIFKKINSKLRDVAIQSHPFIIKKEEIFVGRNEAMNEFEKKYYNLELIKPSVLIASGFEGVGRRKFLKHALDKVGRLNKFHDPITISLDTRDSVEDFILRIEDLNSKDTNEILLRIKDESLEAKIEYAKNLLLEFQRFNEILFILDKGCIVQPNKQIVTWFKKIISAKEFHNSTCVCNISIFRPIGHLSNLAAKIIPFHINELSPTDRQVLFIKYCELFEIAPEKENIERFLSVLNGMPGQIFYTALLIKDHGSEFVAKNIDEIRKFEDYKVFHIIDLVKSENLLSYNLLLFISRFEFISFDLIYRVFGATVDVNESLDSLYVYGIYDRIGIDKEYIKVHHAISDYISRSKVELPHNINQLLKIEIRRILSAKIGHSDVSEILVTVKTLIQNGERVPEKYFIPSVALRTIVELYYQKEYDQLILLADRVLVNHRKYDDHIVREIRYWTAMSLARKKSRLFFDHLKYFEGVDYYFLLGFFRRIEHKNKEAENLFKEALKYDQNSQKTRRELVNVLLSLHKYSQAINWAKENYEKNKLNAFHIQGYFICMLRKSYWNPEEKNIIEELMKNIKISHDFKAKEISKVMEAEYVYYINGEFDKAVGLLKKAIQESGYKHFPIKALVEIYSRRGFKDQEEYFSKMINDTLEEDYIQ